MKITAVDHHKDLFYIEDFYSDFLLNKLNKSDFINYKFEPVIVQGKPVRRNIKLPTFTQFLVNWQSKNNCQQISKFLNQKLSLKNTAVWLDEATYSMDKHLDNINHVSIGMQIYLTDGPKNLGTCFYNVDGSVRYQFLYKKNSGYLMINNSNQTHAMTVSVPDGYFRVSSYHWITYV